MRVKRLEDIHLVASSYIERKKSHFRLTFVAQRCLRLITFPNSMHGSGLTCASSGKILEAAREEFFHDLAQVSLLAVYLQGGVSAFLNA